MISAVSSTRNIENNSDTNIESGARGAGSSTVICESFEVFLNLVLFY